MIIESHVKEAALVWLRAASWMGVRSKQAAEQVAELERQRGELLAEKKAAQAEMELLASQNKRLAEQVAAQKSGGSHDPGSSLAKKTNAGTLRAWVF